MIGASSSSCRPWKIVAVNDSRVSPGYARVKQRAVMFHNDCASRRRGNREAVLCQLVGNADLTEGRLLDRQRCDGILDRLQHAVLQHRLLAAAGPNRRRLS
jgi:hypothetical protein